LFKRNIYIKGLQLPKVTWNLYETATGGGIDVTVDTHPILIRAWSAVTVLNTRFALYKIYIQNVLGFALKYLETHYESKIELNLKKAELERYFLTKQKSSCFYS